MKLQTVYLMEEGGEQEHKRLSQKLVDAPPQHGLIEVSVDKHTR